MARVEHEGEVAGARQQVVVGPVVATGLEELVGVASSMDRLLGAAAEPDGPVMRMLSDDSLYVSMRRTVDALDSTTARVAQCTATGIPRPQAAYASAGDPQTT